MECIKLAQIVFVYLTNLNPSIFIYTANNVLELACSPGYNGVPKSLFKECMGVVLISVIEAGFMFSGNVGTGIILKKKDDDGKVWSPPTACGLTGVGWGFLIGASVKDIIIFIMDLSTLDSLLADKGLKMGGQGELTLGPFGRSYDAAMNVSGQGVGSTVSIAFTKGVFLGLSIEGSIIGARNVANTSFYGKEMTPREILFGESIVVPTNKVTLMNGVYAKLAQLAAGNTSEPDAAEEQHKSAAAAAAEQAAESIRSNPDADIVKVDAAAEAAKESAA
jgi:lipid-binding SYLF domain-containing protein